MCKACLDLLLWKLSKLLVYMLDLGYGFGFTKSLRIPNLIKVSEIESVMLPDKVVNSKLLKKILWIKIFEFPLAVVGWRTNDVKNMNT